MTLKWSSQNREQYFIAIEFAASAVKLVQMKLAGKRFHLLETKSVPVAPYDNPELIKETLKQAVSQILSGFDLDRHSVFLLINSLQTYFGTFSIPNIARSEIHETLKWKVKDQLPFSIEEAHLDYKIVPLSNQEKDSRISVLVTASPRKICDVFKEILRESRCNSFEVVNAAFSVSNLPYAFAQSTRHLVAVVDVGHRITEIALYAGGRLDFLRKIAFGGELLSQALVQPIVTEQGRVSLSAEEADRARHEGVLLGSENQNLIAGKVEAAKLYPLIRPALQKLTGELRRSFDYYSQEHGEGIERIFLTGGGSRLKGFVQFVEQTLQVPVKPVYFFQDIEIADKLREEDLNAYYRLISAILDRHSSKKLWLQRLFKSGTRAIKFFSYRQTAVGACVIFALLFVGLMWQSLLITKSTTALRAQIQNLQPGFEEAQKIKIIQQRISRIKALIARIFSREPYWEDVFRELSQAFSKEVILSEFAYQNGSFVMRGSFPLERNEALLSKLISQLEGPVFRKVTLINTERNDKEVVFSIRGDAS